MPQAYVHAAVVVLPNRYWLKGPKAGTSDVFMDNLPGPPDGISKAADGQNYWITIYSQVCGQLLAVTCRIA